ncbi:WbqC family protein [Pseudoduganella violacea]|uniref:WbqC family protein n=1 Tax=Pseudoduganella violacea TaxID=1715466 RepID=A0A7W5BCT4_9BURK|nr:WbqC family protein [Pseudoduganella violacea]MBB3120852.1 hypothetical protein [Pseudoduganella violacea]
MRVALMQPYFLPYIGYFQLIGAVDLFVIYDNIKYTKKGWINRNRMLLNGSDTLFSLPLAAASDSLDVCERTLVAPPARHKWLAQMKGAYRHAPHFASTARLLDSIAGAPEENLFAFLHQALLKTCAHLDIGTPIRLSSTVPIDHALKGQDKVLAICQAVGASTYINAIGGTELYSRDQFAARGLQLQFLRSLPFDYPQFGAPFVPWLSIADVMMFNPVGTVRERVMTHYELI